MSVLNAPCSVTENHLMTGRAVGGGSTKLVREYVRGLGTEISQGLQQCVNALQNFLNVKFGAIAEDLSTRLRDTDGVCMGNRFDVAKEATQVK